MERTNMQVDPRHVQRIGDRDFVKFEGLLDLAHRQGLKGVETELIQAPMEGNNYMAIIQARVTTERGTFSGIGDATPKNVNGRIAPHIVRMAETRAVARALRLACNIGMCSVEELGDFGTQAETRPPVPQNGQAHQGREGRQHPKEKYPF